jgi:hypothetical protein
MFRVDELKSTIAIFHNIQVFMAATAAEDVGAKVLLLRRGE